MTRVKKGVHALKRRRSVLKQTKGMRQERSSKERSAKDALLHAGAYSFAHRKDKKSHNRKLWNIKINAGYSKMIGALSKKKIMLDRKILADLAENNPEVFAKIIAQVK
ncbi:MAG: 50S ribosomal protein L20 [Candidatus Nomurabacteria bacterium]|nr:50S ribosomal protein L20 [Candidatus Nomurabacteria bacterium]